MYVGGGGGWGTLPQLQQGKAAAIWRAVALAAGGAAHCTGPLPMVACPTRTSEALWLGKPCSLGPTVQQTRGGGTGDLDPSMPRPVGQEEDWRLVLAELLKQRDAAIAEVVHCRDEAERWRGPIVETTNLHWSLSVGAPSESVPGMASSSRVCHVCHGY